MSCLLSLYRNTTGHCQVYTILSLFDFIHIYSSSHSYTKPKKQTSETFRLSAILAISGGFQDAYTYNVRDEVFSNAQTGNVVLMSQNFMSGEWMRGLHYLFPIIAFALGVFVAERIQKKLKYVKNTLAPDNRAHGISHIIYCRAYPRYIQYGCNNACIIYLLNAGSDFQKSKRIWLCKYNVYRKSKKRHRKSFDILTRKETGNLKKSVTLLWNNICVRYWSRNWWNFIIVHRHQSYMGIINPVSNSICHDVY